ncbi:MAG TPA: hypothetical protein VIJ47_01620 [Acidimicrobiales bacterium]
MAIYPIQIGQPEGALDGPWSQPVIATPGRVPVMVSSIQAFVEELIWAPMRQKRAASIVANGD